MVRTSSVDYELVAKACSSLFLEGKNTSFDGVYDILGRKGSAKVVQGLIADWRKEMAERFVAGRTNPDLPQELVEASDRLLAGVWQLSLSKSEEAYAGERLRLVEAEAGMAEKIDIARNRAAGFERENLTLQEKARGLDALLVERDATIVSQQQDMLEVATLLRAKIEEMAGLREDMVRLSATLVSERQAHEVTLQSELERHETALQVERQRHEEAIETERTRAYEAIEREREMAVGERQHLMAQTDQIRQAARITETSLREQLVESKEMSEAFRAKAGKAESAIEYQRGRAESAEDATLKTREDVSALQEEITSLKLLLQLAEQAAAAAGRSGTDNTIPPGE